MNFTKFTWFRRVRRYVRDKILLPIANWLIGSNSEESIVFYIRKNKYEARYHRFRYWYDGEPITISGIIRKRNEYHVSYWDCGDDGREGAVQMWGRGLSIIVASRSNVKYMVRKELVCAARYWRKEVTHIEEDEGE